MQIIGNNLTFTDKDSYLSWRTAWRAAYKSISKRIRSLRLAGRSRQRIGSRGWNGLKDVTTRTLAREQRIIAAADDIPAEFNDHGSIGSARHRAEELMILRGESKLRCQEQWKAAKDAAEEVKKQPEAVAA